LLYGHGIKVTIIHKFQLAFGESFDQYGRFGIVGQKMSHLETNKRFGGEHRNRKQQKNIDSGGLHKSDRQYSAEI
jgi:hypothetical protein